MTGRWLVNETGVSLTGSREIGGVQCPRLGSGAQGHPWPLRDDERADVSGTVSDDLVRTRAAAALDLE